METASINNASLSQQYLDAMRKAAALPLSRVSDFDAQVEAVSFAFGRHVGKTFFSSYAKTVDCAQQEQFFRYLEPSGLPPFRSLAFRAVFLGKSKKYKEQKVIAAVSAAANIANQPASALVGLFFRSLHANYETYASKSSEEVEQCLHKMKLFEKLGQRDFSLASCNAILSSKDYTKSLEKIERWPREAFYFQFLRRAVRVADDAGATQEAAIWLTKVLAKPRWQTIPGSQRLEDIELAASLLSTLASSQKPWTRRLFEQPESKLDQQSVRTASEVAKDLWGEVVRSGLFLRDGDTEQQSQILAAKEKWANLSLHQLMIKAPRDWVSAGDAELDKLSTFCGLEVVKHSDWVLTDFAPLDSRLTALQWSIVRHAEGTSDTDTFFRYINLAGQPGTLKTSFGGALAAAIGRELKEKGGKRKFLALRWPDGFGLQPVFSGSASFTVSKLKELETRAKEQNLTILLLADEMETLFVDDVSQGSAAVENRRTNQSWYSWLDSSKQKSSLFFFFTMNEMATLPKPLRDRLESRTVIWNQPPPLALRQFLRRSPLHVPLKRIEADLSGDLRAAFEEGHFCRQLCDSAARKELAYGTDALLACAPDLTLRPAKTLVDLYDEMQRSDPSLTRGTALMRAMAQYALPDDKSKLPIFWSDELWGDPNASSEKRKEVVKMMIGQPFCTVRPHQSQPQDRAFLKIRQDNAFGICSRRGDDAVFRIFYLSIEEGRDRGFNLDFTARGKGDDPVFRQLCYFGLQRHYQGIEVILRNLWTGQEQSHPRYSFYIEGRVSEPIFFKTGVTYINHQNVFIDRKNEAYCARIKRSESA